MTSCVAWWPIRPPCAARPGSSPRAGIGGRRDSPAGRSRWRWPGVRATCAPSTTCTSNWRCGSGTSSGGRPPALTWEWAGGARRRAPLPLRLQPPGHRPRLRLHELRAVVVRTPDLADRGGRQPLHPRVRERLPAAEPGVRGAAHGRRREGAVRRDAEDLALHPRRPRERRVGLDRTTRRPGEGRQRSYGTGAAEDVHAGVPGGMRDARRLVAAGAARPGVHFL